jgi:antitoxin component HigA of HigAB toxin-antitoxin module
MDTLPVECIHMIAAHLSEKDRASLRAASPLLAHCLPPAACWDLERLLLQSRDAAFWEWAFPQLPRMRSPAELLRAAAEGGHLCAVQELMTAYDRGLLRTSCEHGQLGVVRHIVDTFGVTAHEVRSDENWMLMMSCRNCHVDVVRYLKATFGLTLEDLRERMHWRYQFTWGNAEAFTLDMMRCLREEFGITVEDVCFWADYSFILQIQRPGMEGLPMIRYLHEEFGYTGVHVRKICYHCGPYHAEMEWLLKALVKKPMEFFKYVMEEYDFPGGDDLWEKRCARLEAWLLTDWEKHRYINDSFVDDTPSVWRVKAVFGPQAPV